MVHRDSSMLSIDQKLDKLFTLMASGLVAVGKDVGGGSWPVPVFNPVEGDMYVAKYLLESLHQAFSSLQVKGYTDREMSLLLKAPSRIAQLYWPFDSIGLSNLSKQEQVDLAIRILDCISFYREDAFCDGGRNIVWMGHEIAEQLEKLDLLDLADVPNAIDYRRMISKLAGALWLYCELLYFTEHSIGHEFHGPYELADRRTLVVREYYDLNPEFWPFASRFPHNKIIISVVYEGNSLGFDFFNRTWSSEPAMDPARAFSIHLEAIDTPPLHTLDEISQVYMDVQTVLAQGSTEAGGMEKKALLKRFAESYFYVIKPLLEANGQNWLPPDSVYKAIDNEIYADLWMSVDQKLQDSSKLPEAELMDVLREAWDPRI